MSKTSHLGRRFDAVEKVCAIARNRPGAVANLAGSTGEDVTSMAPDGHALGNLAAGRLSASLNSASDVKPAPVRPKATDPDVEKGPSGPFHWRNRWRVPERHAHLARQQGALPLGDGTWLGFRKFASSDLAERHASRYIDYNLRHFDIGYLGTEFFPEY